MEPEDAETLRKHYAELADDLDPRAIYGDLIQGGIISSDDKEYIESKEIRRSRAEELIDVLRRKGPKAYGVFKQALLKRGYKHLYQLLEGTENSSSEGKDW